MHKLIARHPHVFPDKTLTSERQSDEVLEEGQIKNNWEALKRRDRKQKGVIGRLADVPLALPALSRSTKLQKRASRHGFDWSHINQVVEKIDEELAEQQAREDGVDFDTLPADKKNRLWELAKQIERKP